MAVLARHSAAVAIGATVGAKVIVGCATLGDAGLERVFEKMVDQIDHELTPEQSARLDMRSKNAVAEEIADVLLYLTRLADVLGIDPIAAARRKIRVNARKYPVRQAKGNARKYNAL